MAAQTDRGVPFSTLSPKFLHTNSTSHTWPFSAIAELIDNAYDPDVSAKQFWIDKTVVKGEECLSFMDNGNGLDHDTMHKMLSFGYSDKMAVNGQEPIGIYGNGFKSGSMRLGRDAIVFSKSKSTSCVGMLSQTYLEKIDAQQIIVPIVCFEERDKNNISVKEEHKASLQDILRYSPFNTPEELLAEVNTISSPWSTQKTGTRIIIWNLRRTSTGTTEFDFEIDRYDIRIPSELYETMNDPSQPQDRVTSYIPETVYSLRAYCSILYLKPRMQIVVRGQKVKSELIAKSLACIRKDTYRPNFLNRPVRIIFGYNTKSKDQYGIMMYHKNRLIKGYERVGCQLKANNKGVGVIGVIECNFLDPTHNKQSFNETDKYRKTINNLGIKLEEYWKEIRFRKKTENPNSTVPVEDTMKRPDQNWAQCDGCLKWRKLPDGIDTSKLPSKWYCHMNPDPQFRTCQVDEEPEDSDDDQPYRKTYKQQEREEEKKRLQAEENRRREKQRLALLAEQTKAFKERQEELKRQTAFRYKNTKGPNGTVPVEKTMSRQVEIPTVSSSASPQGGGASAGSFPIITSTFSQSTSSPSSSSGLPVISGVCSLSVNTPSVKRTLPETPRRSLKRPRVNGLHTNTSDTPSSTHVSPGCSPSVPIVSDTDDDETDDDIFILETASTPKPKKPICDLNKVKKEKEQSDANLTMLLECSDDAAVEDTSKTNEAGTSSAGSAAAGANPSPAPPPEVSTATTQTEVGKVKQEVEDQNPTLREEEATQSTGTEQGLDLNVEQQVIKQESSGDSQSDDQGKKILQNGFPHHQESDENAGSSNANANDQNQSPRLYPNIGEIQEQQDQLLELMENTAQERDSLKEQVHKLTCQLQDVESRLHQISVKKECSHQASQTEESKQEKNCNSLDKVGQASVSTAKEEDIDEIALQVDCLVRELDEKNKEKDDLLSKVESLEEEKAKLVEQCEELRLRLQQQQRVSNPTPQRTSNSSAQSHPEEAGEDIADCGEPSSSDTSKSLIELRHNIGRLLVSIVPALDLEQVNYECNVIDEILEQVLISGDYVTNIGHQQGMEQEMD